MQVLPARGTMDQNSAKGIIEMIRATTTFLVSLWFLMMFIAACAGIARAQGSRKGDTVFNAQRRPIAGASVRVCTSEGTGQPCMPQAQIYSDPALTQALANPISTNGLGIYNFYAAPGRYMIEVSGPGITAKQIPNVLLPSDPSTPAITSVTTTSGISVFSFSLVGNLTVNGSTAVSGLLSVGGFPVPAANQDNQSTAGLRFKGPIPWRDITAYMPAGGCSSTDTSDPNTIGTINKGSASLALAAPKDFKNGCGIAVLHAGPTSTIAAPSSSCTISAVSRTSNVSTVTCAAPHGIPLNNLVQSGVNVTGVSDSSFNVALAGVTTVPDATHFTYTNRGSNASSSGGTASTLIGYAHGVTGSTTYKYRVVAIDANMGYSPATPAVTITNGNATLTRDNYNWIGYTLSPGFMFGIYSDQGLAGSYTCVGTSFTNGYSDYGMLFPCPAFLPATPPGAAGNQTLNTTIVSGGGTTTLTLAATASNNATTQNVYYDESSFIDSCLTDANNDNVAYASGYGCYLPAGGYAVNGPIHWFTAGTIAHNTSRLSVAGGIKLNTIPLFLRDRPGSNSIIECIGSGGGIATFSHVSTCLITVGVHVPAVVAIEGAPVVSFSGFTANNLKGHGIWVGSDYTPTLGLSVPTSYSFDRDILTEDANGAGSPMVFDGNTIGVYAKDDAVTTATSATGLPSIQFSGQSPYNNVMCCMYFDNLSSTGYGIRIDQPGGNNSGGGTNTLNFRNWIHESLPASAIALVNHDNGPNAPNTLSAIAPLNSISLINVNSSDPVNGPAATSLFGEFGTTVGITNALSNSIAGFGSYLKCGNGSMACADNTSINGYFNALGPVGGDLGNGMSVTPQAIHMEVPALMKLGLSSFGSSLPAWAQILPPPNLFHVTSTGAGELSAGTYCMVVVGKDAQTTPGLTLKSGEVCQTVGASSVINLSWQQASGSLNQAYSGFRLYYGSSAGNETNYLDLAPGGNPYTYAFMSTAGNRGGTPPTTSNAYLSWLYWDRGTKSCLLCTSSAGNLSWQLGIGEANPGTGVKLAVAGGTIQGEAGIQAGKDVAFNASPRGAYNAFLPNLTSAAATYQRMALDKAITVTRLQLVLGTAGAGCTTQSTVSVTDGTNSVTLTTANGAAIYDSGVLSQNFAAAVNLDIKIATAASGCTTAPQNANVNVQYRMQ